MSPTLPISWSRLHGLTCCAVVGLLAVGACDRHGKTTTRPAGHKLNVFISIPPQKFFAERIGGDRVTVSVLLKPGQSHHTFEPTVRQIVELGQADVFLRIGVPFEQQVVAKLGAALKDLTIVDTCEGIELRHEDAACEHEEHADHTNESDVAEAHNDEHHAELDPHTWMSPRVARIQAGNICKAFQRLDPAHGDKFEANLRQLEQDLDRVDTEIRQILTPLRGRDFFVYHPAFGYFADAYGLHQVAVEVEGKQPTARQIEDLIQRAHRDGVKLIFVQPQFSTQAAESVAQAIGGAVVPMDPLAEDYLDNLMRMAVNIQQALTGDGTTPASTTRATGQQ